MSVEIIDGEDNGYLYKQPVYKNIPYNQNRCKNPVDRFKIMMSYLFVACMKTAVHG